VLPENRLFITSFLMPNKFSFISFFLCCICSAAYPQLQANFTVDKSGGCAPLTVQFTNTSTGTSSSTVYDWVFGNGNSSKLEKPGANFLDEGTYNVTLTVKDGAEVSSKSMVITVYKKPVVDFTASDVKGCVPLTVTFTSNSAPGDGTIAKYYWDFGDGKTLQGTDNTVSHDYTFAQNPPVSLTLTNSFGCYNTSTKSNIVEAVAAVSSSFTTSTTSICNVGEAVQFNTKITGAGDLTYTWDFGDGKTANTTSPSHVYSSSGAYTVNLNVKSSFGCEANAKPTTINVSNFVADFEIPNSICQNQEVSFKNESTQPYESLEWWVDNVNYGYNGVDNLKFTFKTAGEHTIKLVAIYGNCPVSVTKKITVNPLPQIAGFIASLQGTCGVPVTVSLQDTSSTSTQWQWRINNANNAPFATTKTASHTFTTGSEAPIFLTVTNKEGCNSTATKTVSYGVPKVEIVIKPKPGNINTNSACVGVSVDFGATPDNLVQDFLWNFGDGETSTEREPSHIYRTAARYTITLDYTTKSGCVGKATYANVSLVDKPNFDFTAVEGTTVCGNNPVTIKATAAPGWQFYWLFSDYRNYRAGSSTFTRQFDYDTTYTVRIIAYNGNCRDTVTKTNYITVLPAFPKIKEVLNTCADTRGLVTFVDSSRKAEQWHWDFGDGNNDSYTNVKETISHTYANSGAYKVTLTTTNGACSTKDSITAYVLLKQNPQLNADKTEICSSDSVSVGLNGLEPNPYVYFNTDSVFSYSIPTIQYGDFSTQPNTIPFTPNAARTAISATMTKFISGKNGFRLITNSDYFNCADTTNFLPLRVHGPVAGFSFTLTSDCFKTPVAFTDTSRQFENTAITKWQWNFGDKNNLQSTTNGNASHTYINPGNFYPTLTVTDADGCTSTTSDSIHKVTLKGPKADFSASSFKTAPETTVDFLNTSLGYDKANSQLKWLFSNGSESTLENPSFYYPSEGSFDVRLTTRNTQTNCADTIVKTIQVKKPNSAFTHTISYVNNNNCPPAIANFTSAAVGATRLRWDFGDGSQSGDQAIVSHIYSQPGLYRVTHYSYDANNAVDSTEDIIEVKGPYAILKADTLYACNELTVKLTADVRNASNFTWDFGDGTLTAGTDTFASHTYVNPGIYTVALILKDASGCVGNSVLPQKITIDSLYASNFITPDVLCTGGQVVFVANASSFSQNQLQQSPAYYWELSNNTMLDTFNTAVVQYSYNTAGKYPVTLRVTTAFGCETIIETEADIKQSIVSSINGPSKVCRLADATFAGNASPYSDTLQWRWDFGTATADLQNPQNQVFNTAGDQIVTLIVSNGFCSNTAYHTVLVQEIPAITFSPAQPFVCLGDSVAITASGGISYQWSPNRFIKNANQASAIVWPDTTGFYKVKVTNDLGCTASDSVQVAVIQPLQITAPSPLFACAGNAVQLRASGAEIYQWQDAAELSNPQIANPVARTLVSKSYTVVGSDSQHCFSDTAIVTVRIGQLPTVQAGPDFKVVVGTEIRLTAVASSDVVRYSWLPTDFLSCPSCSTTLSKPLQPTNYVVTVTNNDGCIAKDSVRVELICTKDIIYIPTGFTPNGDNLNDRFAILGAGIKSIRNLVIYDRWGRPVFERKNVDPLNRNSSWDGKFKGEPQPTGAYIYVLDLECAAGEYFSYKGTVMLIR
jgi:gliding motility-associated-like protein